MTIFAACTLFTIIMSVSHSPFPRFPEPKHAYQIMLDVMRSNVVLFLIKVCRVDRLCNALYRISHQYSTVLIFRPGRTLVVIIQFESANLWSQFSLKP